MNNKTIFSALIIVLAASAAQAGVGSTCRARSATVPFAIEHIFGERPVVEVSLGKMRYRMVIHSNAGFYSQMDHKHAMMADARIFKHSGAFGIEAAGKVSALGRDEGVLPLLYIGECTLRDAPVSIFETPGDDATGMLGLKWISENLVVIDYPDHKIYIAPTRTEMAKRNQKLRRGGYTTLPMFRDNETGRYYVIAKIENRTRRMTVNTVASLTIDTAFANAAHLAIGPISSEYGGPGGATGYTYAFGNPIRLSIGNWTSKPIIDGSIEDTYAYMGIDRPANDMLAIGGMIGADFLISHHAIIDFGNLKLYLR
jgi:hypothetical protein